MSGSAGSGDDLGQFAIRRAQGDEGADQQVQGNRWVAGFHLGDARLAGLKFRGQIHLRQPLPLSPLTQCFGKPNFHFDVGGLLCGEAEKILGSTDFPSLAAKRVFFSLRIVIGLRATMRSAINFMGADIVVDNFIGAEKSKQHAIFTVN